LREGQTPAGSILRGWMLADLGRLAAGALRIIRPPCRCAIFLSHRPAPAHTIGEKCCLTVLPSRHATGQIDAGALSATMMLPRQNRPPVRRAAHVRHDAAGRHIQGAPSAGDYAGPRLAPPRPPAAVMPPVKIGRAARRPTSCRPRCHRQCIRRTRSAHDATAPDRRCVACRPPRCRAAKIGC
jgi:hypothetical protein